MNIKFLIIVPHGFRDSRIKLRHNDIRALETAEKLQKKISSMGYSSDFYVADKLRSTIDYNREVSRFTHLRNNIRRKLHGYHSKGDYIIVLEIHSFPDNYTFYDFKGSSIALLSIPEYFNKANLLSKYVNKNTKLNTIALEGTETHDIQIDTSKEIPDNIEHYLIEFHENKSVLSDKEIDLFLNKSIKFLLGDEPKENKKSMFGIAATIIISLFIICVYIYIDNKTSRIVNKSSINNNYNESM